MEKRGDLQGPEESGRFSAEAAGKMSLALLGPRLKRRRRSHLPAPAGLRCEVWDLNSFCLVNAITE